MEPSKCVFVAVTSLPPKTKPSPPHSPPPPFGDRAPLLSPSWWSSSPPIPRLTRCPSASAPFLAAQTTGSSPDRIRDGKKAILKPPIRVGRETNPGSVFEAPHFGQPRPFWRSNPITFGNPSPSGLAASLGPEGSENHSFPNPPACTWLTLEGEQKLKS